MLPAFCFASNPGKRWTEGFFLLYSPFWILWALGILVPFKLYEVRGADQSAPMVLVFTSNELNWRPISVSEECSNVHSCHITDDSPDVTLLCRQVKLLQGLNEAGYMAVGLAAALPCAVLPALLHGSNEKGKSWDQQYWVKANVWIAIFSFIGNYFWTHYFYDLLGAQYTFPSWQLNKVCCSYHTAILCRHSTRC